MSHAQDESGLTHSVTPGAANPGRVSLETAPNGARTLHVQAGPLAVAIPESAPGFHETLANLRREGWFDHAAADLALAQRRPGTVDLVRAAA